MKNDRDVKLKAMKKAPRAVEPVEMNDTEKLDEAENTLRLAYAIANNAIHMGDKSEYLAALHGVCSAIIEDEDDWQTSHGSEFITDIADVELS